MTRTIPAFCALTVPALLALATPAAAQTDEIQVYTGEINKPGEFSITLHNNYTPSGRAQPDFPGGVVPDHAWNGVPEFAYGVNEWWEVGAYIPVYTITDRRLEFDSVKLRTLFAVPHAEERSFFYAINFEFSYNAPQWDQSRFTGEIRPIIGVRFGQWDFIINPIIDYAFTSLNSLAFAPAERIAYNISSDWALAVEHYADYGQFQHFYGGPQQGQYLFGVVDYSGEPVNVEFGVGHGFTAGSDSVVVKLMLTHTF